MLCFIINKTCKYSEMTEDLTDTNTKKYQHVECLI